MFASWNQINWNEFFSSRNLIDPLPRRKADMAGGRYLADAVAAFDIETSRIDLPIPKGAKQNSHSFMYVWQFQIEDITIMGRTWDECFKFFAAIRDAVQAMPVRSGAMPPRLVIWVHNLAYEWQFLQGIYEFENEDVFLRDARQPIYCRMWDTLEFRCSYIQTNMSLKHLTKQLGVEEKLSGQEFDYNKIRYPWTPLSEYETEYCIRDVRSLVACMKKRMLMDGDTLQTIPLTSTGYVRRDCKKAISQKPLCWDIRDMKPKMPVYRLLREAFRGGNTHGNRKMVGRVLENVVSYDMTSCYPAQQLTKRFPMRKFQMIGKNVSPERIVKYIGLGYAVVARYIFKNIKLKEGVTIPYISLSRTKSYGFLGGIDNGRILYAECCQMTMTEIDLEIVQKQYTWDEMFIDEAMVAKKDYLPEEYRKVIKDYYDKKTILKGATDEEEIYQYNKSKEKLNAVYGMSCQDPIHAEILYNAGDYTRRNLYDYPEEADKALAHANFPYQWGVYVTAYARKALQDAIDIAGDRMVYCDTDSVKVLGDIDLSALNEKRQRLADRMGAVARDRTGVPHYMGVFEREGKGNGPTYDKFITQGAKRYAYITDGKMGVTVSGVSKAINEKTGIPIAVEELGSLENFKENMIWKRSAGAMSVYNDDDKFVYDAPDGSGSVVISPNVAILPTTYNMGFTKDYKMLLNDIELYGEYIDRRS